MDCLPPDHSALLCLSDNTPSLSRRPLAKVGRQLCFVVSPEALEGGGMEFAEFLNLGAWHLVTK